MKKTEDIGGTSDAWDIPYLVEIFKILNPRTVLDIGTGCFGKNGYILRQYVEHKFRHIYKTEYMEITGLEAYPPNAKFVGDLRIYDILVNEQALPFLVKGREKYDIVICTHVLEHHEKEQGWILLKEMIENTKKAIVLACPYGEYKFEGHTNPFQDHKSSWIPDEIAKYYPITTPIFGHNNTGHQEFLIVIPK